MINQHKQPYFTAFLAITIAFCLLGGLLLLHPLATHAQSQPEALGSISGTVRNAQGDPLPNISVSIPQYADQAGGIRTATTNAQGKYTLLSLPPGAYRVKFQDANQIYATTYYREKAMWSDANLVNVSGNNVANIDEQLTLGGSIALTITTPITYPDVSVNVNLYGKTTSGRWETYSTLYWPYQNSEPIFAGLPAGRYRLCATVYNLPFQPYLGECYDNAIFSPNNNNMPPADATDIVVNAGQQQTITMGFDIVDIPSQLQGIVRSTSGEPIANTILSLRDALGFENHFASSDANGYFRFASIYDGRYTLRANDLQNIYLPTYYDNASAPEQAKTLEINTNSRYSLTLTMPLSGRIVGKLRAQGGGIPWNPGITVYIAPADGSSDEASGLCASCSYTYEPATGVYTVTGLTTGKYRVQAAEWINNQSISAFYGGHDFQTADDVSVTIGLVVRDIDIRLGEGRFDGAITGSATANGVPKAGIEVSLYTHQGYMGQPIVSTTTDAQGNYRIGGLFSGHYDISFRDPQGNFAATVYGESIFSPTAVIITGAHTIAGVNAELTPGSTIRGSIKRREGQSPIDFQVFVMAEREGWYVFPFISTQTDSSGNYTLSGLPPGSYVVATNYLYCCPTGIFPRYYPTATDPNLAQRITVGEGVEITGIDILVDFLPRAYLPFIGDRVQASD